MNTETFEHTEPLAPPPIEERPIHLARCAECGLTVRYRPNSTGTGFILVDSEELYGVGENSRPVCPHGHGEMEVADDQLPIEQAMTQVAEQLDTAAPRLPFPVPPFNYEGVLRAICETRHEIAKLEKKVSDRKDSLKRAKDELDEANADLGKMIDRFEQDEQDRLAEIARREARAAAGHPEETNLLRCLWEEQHPDETCPICDPDNRPSVERFGLGDTARDSALHVEAADRYQHLIETDEIVELVGSAGIRLAASVVSSWSVEDRQAVNAWAEAEIGLADKPADHQRPAILGTAHVASDLITSEADGETYQCCKACGARLLTCKTGGDPEQAAEKFQPYPGGTLVGTDCKGADPNHHYPKTRRRKK